MEPSLPNPAEPLVRVADALFRGKLMRYPAGLRLHLEGTLSHEEPQALLDPFFRQVHEQAVQAQAREVVVDFLNLEFMNSSSFKSLITWISAVQNAPARDQYRIVFSITRTRRWQATSIHALRCFALDLVGSVDAA